MKKNKELYLIVIWIILIFAVVLIFVIPNMKKIKALTNEVTETEKQLQGLQNSGQSKKEAEENFRLIKKDLATIEAIIPKRGQELSLITTLEEIANQNNLQQKMNIYLTDSKTAKAPAGNAPAADKNSLPFQLTIDGKLINFLNYLNDLEKLKYYLNITSIKINQSQTPTAGFFETETPIISSTDNIHLVINGISYWQ